MTEKLYYIDAYIREFDASVISCEEKNGNYEVVLDRTAFFPEEGGQSADTGFIGDVRVIDARERGGVIYHITDGSLRIGGIASCRIDFEDRYAKMQCHTAEHILSGYFKRLYGFDNVGFHLGTTDVTMDINGVLTRKELDEVELLANMAVYANVPVTAYFPTPEELSALEYRSKLDLTENVRIVKVGDYDTCACCAPHVASSGEIGIIKMLDFEKHRGGLRIHMAAGKRALLDYREKYANTAKISALLCEPQATVASAVDRLLAQQSQLTARVKSLLLEKARGEALRVEPTSGNAVFLFDDMSHDELREFCNYANSRIGGVLVALSGADGEYKYTVMSDDPELQALVKRMNTELGGRGGGKGSFAQGTLYTDLYKIKQYFKI